MKKFLVSIAVFICMTIPLVWPLLQNGYFPMHDDTQIARVVTMGKALRDGQFPVRWVSDLGYGFGYPIFNFYGPLPYYVGGILYALGLSGLLATKIMMLVGIIFSGISMYIIMSKFFGKSVGFLSGLLYAYFPYHAVQLYVRGAVGELWILIFLPLIVANVYEIFQKKHTNETMVIGGVGLAGVILSHTVLGFTTTFFYCLIIGILVMGVLINKFQRSHVFTSIGTLLLGISLSCFFWLPAITEMKYTNVSGQIGPTAQVLDHFVCLGQFFYSPWGFGGSTPGCTDGLSFALGKIHLAVIVLGIAATIYAWKKKYIRILGISAILITLVSIFFMTSSSAFLWNILPGFSYVQYPWRFLVYTSLGIALFAVPLLMSFSNKILRGSITVGVCFAIIVLYSKLFVPQYMYTRPLASFESNEDIKFRASSVSDEYLPVSIDRPHNPSQVVNDVIPSSDIYTYKNIIDKDTYKKIEFISKTEQKIILKQAYFPGWKYWVNSVPQPLKLDKGMPVITIPNDFSTLEMKFTDTPPRLIGNFISLMGVIILGYYYGKKTIR